jgi:tRNA A22 N-methylase
LKLSHRLNSLKAHHRQQPSIWDIGCDHGQLGLSFLDDPLVQAIHLVDPSAKVMHELKQKIDSYITKGHHKIHLYHQSGQDTHLDLLPKCIFIAGMGGAEILAILRQLEPQLSAADQIVISPHRKILELRAALSSSPLRLEREEVIEEGGLFYEIIGLSKRPELPPLSRYGEATWEGEVGRRYREHVLGIFSAHQDPASMEFIGWLSGR